MRAFTANPSISPEEDNSAGRVSIPDTMGAKAAGIGIPTYLLRSYGPENLCFEIIGKLVEAAGVEPAV